MTLVCPLGLGWLWFLLGCLRLIAVVNSVVVSRLLPLGFDICYFIVYFGCDVLCSCCFFGLLVSDWCVVCDFVVG